MPNSTNAILSLPPRHARKAKNWFKDTGGSRDTYETLCTLYSSALCEFSFFSKLLKRPSSSFVVRPL